MILFTQIACTKNTAEKVDCMINKLWYAEFMDFILFMNIDGQWYIGNMFNEARRLVNPERETFIDFYTEVKFFHYPEEIPDISETIIAAWPNPDNAQGIINAINWGILSEGDDLKRTLSRFGFSYPISVENLVNDWNKINTLLRRNNQSFLIAITSNFARVYGNEGSRIAFELFYLFESGDGVEEHIYEILNSLNLTEDEGAILLRQSGSYDAFVFITNLMLEEGLSFERARRRYERETSSTNVTDYGSLHAQQIIRIDTMLFNS